jgi:hypothetical protein
MDQKSNKFTFLGLAFLPFGVLALEFGIALIQYLFYGTMDFWKLKVRAIIIHWICTIIIWSTGLLVLNILSKKAGYHVFENKNSPKIVNWIVVGIIIVITVIGSFMVWEMRFKPFAEFNGFIKKYGNIGIAAFVFQYMYYLIETMLFLAIIIFAQEFGEKTFKNNLLPWGGIMCGLTWGLGHIATQDLFTGIYFLIESVFYGIVYIQLKKNVRYAYIIIAVMFMV